MSDELVEIDEGEIMPARKKPEEGDLDITPMIDITFLLLIFFIVTSNLEQQSRAKLPTAKNGTTVSAKDSAVITMTTGGSEGRAAVYLGDAISEESRAEDNDLNLQEEEIATYIEQSFAGSLDNGVPKRHLLIKAAGEIPHGEVERVALAAMRSGVVDSVEPLYLGVENKK